MTSGGNKKFLDPAVLSEAATQVTELAANEGVRVALVGGFALQLYGSDRLTGDVDFAAERLLEALAAEKPLTFGGAKVRAPNGVDVDLVVRCDDFASLYEEALERAQPMQGSATRVVQPEYLAAMKMIAGRPRDDADLAFLITSKTIDFDRTRAILRKHLGPYAVTEFDRVVEEVQWLASKGRL
jgi:hypothetical protein